jgi:hypothetical protein
MCPETAYPTRIVPRVDELLTKFRVEIVVKVARAAQ